MSYNFSGHTDTIMKIKDQVPEIVLDILIILAIQYHRFLSTASKRNTCAALSLLQTNRQVELAGWLSNKGDALHRRYCMQFLLPPKFLGKLLPGS